MTPHYSDDWLTVYGGDCRQVLAELSSDSVDCVMTSPPYWGLRDYGTDGQLGLERTPEEYVANMVAVFRQIKRVLKPSGTCWLNLGDSYVGSAASGGVQRLGPNGDLNNQRNDVRLTKGGAGLKAKDLVGIPWRVAFALQADGWYLRSDIIWSKPNPMPESVTDRPTKAHEYLFLLTKSPRYYFDADAVREEQAAESMASYRKALESPREPGEWKQNEAVAHIGAGATVSPNAVWSDPEKLERLLSRGRNIRSVWNIATRPYPGAHFAVFPPELPERCIKAGSSQRGVCPNCGAPWERQVERARVANLGEIGGTPKGEAYKREGLHTDSSTIGRSKPWKPEDGRTTTTGWAPTCAHTFVDPTDPDITKYLIPVPAVILDPFGGSGTVGMVANRLSRRAILIDLNPEYLEQQMRRNAQTPLGLAQ